MWVPAPAGPERWQLFDLENDPGEIHDLAEREPEKLKEMLESWALYEAETGTILLKPSECENYPVGYGWNNGIAETLW